MPDSLFLVASIGVDYTSDPVIIKDGKYTSLVVSPRDPALITQVVTFHLGGVTAEERIPFQPGQVEFGFELTFPHSPGQEPTATPAPTATPSPTPTDTPVPTPEPGVAIVEVPAELRLSSEGTGVDIEGTVVQSVDAAVRLGKIGEQLVLPILVPEGVTLEAFDDPDSGISVERREDGLRVRIAIRDPEGNDQIRVLVDIPELHGTGTTVEGVVESMGIDLPTKSLDLTDEDQRVGIASVKVIADVTAFPAEAFMKMSIVKVPSDASSVVNQQKWA